VLAKEAVSEGGSSWRAVEDMIRELCTWNDETDIGESRDVELLLYSLAVLNK
jgi:hypothetical protein